MTQPRLVICLLALACAVGGCGESSERGGGTGATAERDRDDPQALRVSEKRTPRVPLRRYVTRGTYPQVSGGDGDLDGVNAALTDAIVRDQRAYARQVPRSDLRRPPGLYPGRYETAARRSLTSASTVLVSTLIPLYVQRIGGNADGGTWISATLRVPSGARIRLRQLFAEPSRGLAALAATARRVAASSSRCVRESLEGVDGATFERGFAPRARNYRYFALTPNGFAVGFPLGQVAYPPCFRVLAVVPYDAVQEHLSSLGRELVEGVRAPAAG